MQKKLPKVALFGRVNVGKSSLFNRLSETNQALVSQIAGTTRDSNIGNVEWQGKAFELIDTGGVIDLTRLFIRKGHGSEIDERVQKQVSDYLKKADLILFTLDGRIDLTEEDRQINILLKKRFKEKNNILLVVNKIEKQADRAHASEFHKLAQGEPILVSAATGAGTGDLLDAIIEKLENLKKKVEIPNTKYQIRNTNQISLCILGQPNVGKSSLLNKIIGRERVIVSPIPHTTREPQDSFLDYKGSNIRIIDTAGLSKKAHKIAKSQKEKIQRQKINELPVYGISKSLGSLKGADIALFVWDVNTDLVVEDLKIVEEIIKKRKSLIIIGNKWDEAEERDAKKYTEYIRSKLPFALWAPILFLSAKTGKGVDKIMDLVLEVSEQRKLKFSNAQLQKFLAKMVKIHRPSRGKGFRQPRIYEITQTGSNPPEIKVRIGKRDDLHFSYLRFLENRLRDKFGFLGTPIKIWVDR